MKVLFINPPPYGDIELPTKPFPIGTLILYSLLKEMNFDVDLYEPDTFTDLHFFLKKNAYDVVGIVCFTRQRLSAFHSAEIVKSYNSNTITIIGGPHVLKIEKKILAEYKFIDVVISGEAEITLPKYLISIRNNDMIEIPNVFTKKDINSNKVSYIPCYLDEIYLSQLPYPYYYSGYFEEYANNSRGNMYFKSNKMAAIQLSRGCDNHCIFCANRVIFGPHKSYTAEYVFDHIEYIYKRFNIRYYDFVDDNFCGNIENAKELCRLLKSSEMKIVWRTSSRLDNIDEESIILMAQSGCKMISFGLESGSQKLLDLINKGVSLKNSVSVLELCKKNNIEIRFSLTFGYKYDNDDSIAETIDFLNRIKPNAIALYLLKVYNGTKLYEMAKNEKYINDDWWFQNTDDAPFYMKYMTFDKFQSIKEQILSGINASIVESYKSKRDDSEFYLKWQ
jgi:anaerobic magnesium-protoporphyrin IX monomethyl ester cyclase